MIYPQLDEHSKDFLFNSFEKGKHTKSVISLVEFIIVARVRPRASKGITDLLLPQTSIY